MEIQKLKDICLTEITDGTHQTPTYSEYGYIFLSSKNVTTQKIDWDNVMFIPEKLHEELYKRVAPQIDDILLAKNGTTGVAAIVDRDIVFDIYVSLALIRPNTEIVMPRYLLYAINNPVVKGYFDSSLKGIGVPNLHLKNIRETPIKIYDLETQKAIVEKLDKVCELISLRKQQLAKLDELVKARFVEMFGERSSIRPQKLKEVTRRVKVGFVGTCEKYYTDNTGVPMLRTTNITSHGIDLKDLKYVTRTFHEKNLKSQVHKGDLLIARHGSNGQANVYCGDEAQCLNAIIIEPDHNITNPIFLENLINSRSVKRQIEKELVGSTQHVLNTTTLANVEVKIPAIKEQQVFATFVERVNQQKQTVQQSLEKLELMKKALMQEYFG